MILKATYFLLLAALASCLSCSAPGTPSASVPCGAPAAPRSPKAKWTIMVYMNGDNDMEPEALKDFAEMASVKDDPNVNVVVQMDRTNTCQQETDETWGETRRFLMRQGLPSTRSCSLPGFNEEANMGSLLSVADFVMWARRDYPAERYALIVWGHADGFFFTEPSLLGSDPVKAAAIRSRAGAEAASLISKDRLNETALASLNLEQTPFGAPFRSVSEDRTNEHDRLFVRELQDGLEKAFKDGGKLDLLGFDACLMQMIETGYAMRRVAHVLVGSEELVPGAGLNYADWLSHLVKDSDVDGEGLGKILVKSYERTYDPVRTDTTFSAVALSGGRIERLAAAVTAFAEELRGSLSQHHTQIVTARRNTLNYAPDREHHGIDLHRFALLISQADVDQILATRAREVIALIDSMVISNYAGAARQGNFGSRGLAIYFPLNLAQYELDEFKVAYTDLNSFYVVQFVLEHNWDNFLCEYFKHETGDPPAPCAQTRGCEPETVRPL